MYESFKQVVNVTGMIDPAQEVEMQQAAEKMAELEQQMASMPPAQRKMMEKMMGPQLEMTKNMSSGGGIQTEIITNAITVNPSLTDANGRPCSTQVD